MKIIAYQRVLASSIILLLSLISCRPVFAIGWTELLILLVLIVILLGPVLFRLFRTLNKIKKTDEVEKKKK
jgi:hypothetical protein